MAPLTAGVLAAVPDDDMVEASAINDAASRVGGVVLIALVPLLLGVSGATDFAGSPADRYRFAMVVLAVVTLAAAVLTALFVPARQVVRADAVPRKGM